MKKTLLTYVSVVLVFVSIALVCALRSQNLSLQKQILAMQIETVVLHDQILQKDKQLKEVQQHNSVLVSSLKETKSPVSENKPEGQLAHTSEVAPLPASTAGGGAVWRAQQLVTDIEEQIAIAPEQKEKLSAAFGALYSSANGHIPTVQEQDTIISEVLGEGSVAQYRKGISDALEKEFEAGIENDSIVLSRKLQLSPSQEAALRMALKVAEQQSIADNIAIREKMKDAMANHFDGEEGKSKLTQQYGELKKLKDEVKKKKDQIIFDQISGALSDGQKNALLAEQASGGR